MLVLLLTTTDGAGACSQASTWSHTSCTQRMVHADAVLNNDTVGISYTCSHNSPSSVTPPAASPHLHSNKVSVRPLDRH